MEDDLKAAIDGLDAGDDAHWTKAGDPDLNVLKEQLGRKVSRGETKGYRNRSGYLGTQGDDAAPMMGSGVGQRSKVGQSPAPELPSRKAHDGEVSSYGAAIRCMDDFIISMEGVQPQRRDPELVVLYNTWKEQRAAVMQRYGRLTME